MIPNSQESSVLNSIQKFTLKQGAVFALGALASFSVVGMDRYTGVIDGEPSEELVEFIENVAPGAPLPQDGEFVHIPPSIDALEDEDIHPKLKETIRRGHDLFVNTQQLRRSEERRVGRERRGAERE